MTDTPTGNPPAAAFVAVHNPIEVLAIRYDGALVDYPDPFATAIYEQASWPQSATVMTPDGPVKANLGDYLVAEVSNNFVFVVPALQFDRLYSEHRAPDASVPAPGTESESTETRRRGRPRRDPAPAAVATATPVPAPTTTGEAAATALPDARPGDTPPTIDPAAPSEPHVQPEGDDPHDKNHSDDGANGDEQSGEHPTGPEHPGGEGSQSVPHEAS